MNSTSSLVPSPTNSLTGDQVRLRRTKRTDLDRLHDIVTQPDVARWWGWFDRARVQREMIEPDDDAVVYAIEVTGNIVGLIQFYEENDPNYRSAGIDIFLDPTYHGRGLGADALRTLARYLFNDRGHHRLTIDPAAGNHRAIRAYERVGFRPVGVMRRYERDSDGVWQDGLLMDLLREELIETPDDEQSTRIG